MLNARRFKIPMLILVLVNGCQSYSTATSETKGSAKPPFGKLKKSLEIADGFCLTEFNRAIKGDADVTEGTFSLPTQASFFTRCHSLSFRTTFGEKKSTDRPKDSVWVGALKPRVPYTTRKTFSEVRPYLDNAFEQRGYKYFKKLKDDRFILASKSESLDGKDVCRVNLSYHSEWKIIDSVNKIKCTDGRRLLDIKHQDSNKRRGFTEFIKKLGVEKIVYNSMRQRAVSTPPKVVQPGSRGHVEIYDFHEIIAIMK